MSSTMLRLTRQSITPLRASGSTRLPTALARRQPLSSSSRLAQTTHALPRFSAHTFAARAALRTVWARRSTRALSSEATAERYGDIPKDAPLGQRLKHLMKKYGWYALGVYLAVSVVDFGLAFGAINLVGADRVAAASAAARRTVMGWVGRGAVEDGAEKVEGEIEKAAEEKDKGGREGLYAMVVLAYTVHKTLFLPFRVGATAAITPRLVGFLRTRGWVGSEGARQAGREMRLKGQLKGQEMRAKAQEIRERAKRRPGGPEP
jgi:hypothetical protein